MAHDGTNQSDSTMTIIDYLTRDHTRLHELLQLVTSRQTFDPEPYAEFREGLLRHIAIEEKVLFPAVKEARGGRPLERAGDLRIDHAALTSLMVPTPDAALCGEVRQLLLIHDAKEEGDDGVYAECEQALSVEELVELGVRAANFPAVRVARHLDRPGSYRTMVAALAAARRVNQPSSRKDSDRGAG